LNQLLDNKDKNKIPKTEKKNYVIEFNKADLKPHLILEKEASNIKQKKNQYEEYLLDNKLDNNNNITSQDLAKENNNFYFNEGNMKFLFIHFAYPLLTLFMFLLLNIILT